MKTKNTKRILTSLLLSVLLLAGCGQKPAEVSETAGIGRPVAETNEDGTPAQPDAETDTSGNPVTPEQSGASDGTQTSQNTGERFQNGKYWDFVNGKYVYSIPARDDSGLATLSELNSVWGVPFEDSADSGDWYTGKLTRDLTTGEVTVAWDRWDSVLELLDQYHGIYRGNTEEKVCYFTFDCGYEYGTTATILDTLRSKQVPALFFLTGTYVEKEAELIQRMLDEGHMVGNHSVNHKQMASLSAEEFQAELTGLEDLFYASFPDAPPMVYYRPPSGDMNQWSLRLADKMGYTSVLWSCTYKDYDTNNQWSHEDALNALKTGLHNGCVYLLHAESETNAAILGDLIDWIRAQGYTILPICDIEF
ncbi:MAG: polysaccharide deacetylase family protein [Clostridia bacterium]|nr:polysaccharide deacetylase family protein [Clostridia bacterium]